MSKVNPLSCKEMKPMTTTTPFTGPDTQTDRLDRLERDNRSLRERLDKLEKHRGNTIASLIGNVILLISAALLIDYLGFLPSFVERLPLKARTVEADDYILRGQDGRPWGVLHVAGQELSVARYGADGRLQKDEPLAKP
jgi:hypothetical protein